MNVNLKGSTPLASIIILTHNSFRYTMECIKSILAYTKNKYELIIVDNASTDGTVQYLKSLENATLIINNSNRGFSGGCNQGFREANGEYIVLLNNDTIVTEGWLSNLIKWLESDENIGIVGPRSNFVLPQQAVTKTPYKSMKEMQEFAAQWAEINSDKGFAVDYLSGFCMVFRKDLIKQIGGFDERFYPGYFEDTDFSIRTSIFGKKLWVANDVYIHHHGSSSYKTKRKYHRKIIEESKKNFLKKWKINNFDQINELVSLEQPFNHDRHYIQY